METRKLRVLVCALAVGLIASLANADIATDLVAHITFDDETADDSAGDNHGVMNGDAAIIDDSGGNGKAASKVLDLDGDGDYVVLANEQNFDFTDALTVAVWVKVRDNWGSGVNQYAGMVVKGGGSWMVQRFNLANTIEFSCDNATHIRDWPDDDPITPSTIEIADGAWHHIVAIFDENGATDAKARLYVDGVLDAKAPFQADGDPFSTSDRQVWIGANPGWGGHALFYGQIDDVRIYNRALSHSDVKELCQGAGAAMIVAPGADATEVPRDAILSWQPGEYAATHDVYLGTSFADVNTAGRDNAMGVLVSESQDANSYDPPGLLDWGQTYYWRIDEVNAAPDFAIYKGGVWSFTVEPFGYPIEHVVATSNAASSPTEGPENTVNGSGLNADDEHSIKTTDMWLATAGADPVCIQYEFDVVYKLHEMLVWNHNSSFELLLGFGLKDVTVEYSENGTDWTLLGDVELAQATATGDYTANTAVDFQGVTARYVRLTVNSGHGMTGQFGLSEVRFTSVPVQARQPEPADGAAAVSVEADLSWRAGREAATHEVSVGTDPDALALVETTSEPTLDPGPLDLAATYYWQITEVNEIEVPSRWPAAIWSFTTEEFLMVEDFEDYDDDENTIFDTWIDGFVNETGSTVGYFEAPFAEQTIVHGGRQSMPLTYDNIGGITVSEATRTFESAQDWIRHGVKGLLIWFYGAADNDTAQMYVKIDGVKVLYDGDAANLVQASWQTWTVDLTGLDVGSVRELTIGVEGTGTGTILIDDILLSP